MEKIIGYNNFQYKFDETWTTKINSMGLGDLCGIAVDSMNRLYLFNRGKDPVIIVDEQGDFITSWGHNIFSRPHGICVDKNYHVYCTDVGDHTLRKFDFNGNLLFTLGVPGTPSDTGCQGRDYRTIQKVAGPFNAPTDVEVTDSGDIYVTDGYGNARIHKFSGDGELLLSWGSPGKGAGEFHLPHGIAVSKENCVYIADRENNRLQIFEPSGKFINQWENIYRPTGICIDQENIIYVSELGLQVGITFGLPEPTEKSPPSRVSIFSPNGELVCKLGDPDFRHPGNFYAAHAIALDSLKNLYVSEVIYAVSNMNPPEDARLIQRLIRL
jgi:DNA-binding beta-propeller fold protein YncE